MERLSRLAVLGLALWLTACGRQPSGGDAAPPLLPRLQTLQAAAGETGGIIWDGVVQAREQALLSAQTGGRVTRLSADVDTQVGRAEVLLQLTADEQRAAVQTAEARLRAAEAQRVDAAARFGRASELAGGQLISRDDLDRVRAAHDSAVAAVDAAAAELAQARQQLEYTTVRAPYLGIVAARHVELGETVAPGQPLFTLYAPSHLRVEVQLPQAQAAAVRARAEAQLWLPDGTVIDAGQVIVYPAADPGAHSTTVRLLLAPADAALRPGEPVKVRFAATAGPAGIWLPLAAVVQRGELAGAYVVTEDAIMLRQLRLGSRQGDQVEVIAGLTAGEEVAVDPDAALQALRRQRGTGAARD